MTIKDQQAELRDFNKTTNFMEVNKLTKINKPSWEISTELQIVYFTEVNRMTKINKMSWEISTELQITYFMEVNRMTKINKESWEISTELQITYFTEVNRTSIARLRWWISTELPVMLTEINRITGTTRRKLAISLTRSEVILVRLRLAVRLTL